MKAILRITGGQELKPRAGRAWLFLLFLIAADQIVAQPANDAFAGRISLSGSSLTVTGNNQYATREPDDPTQGDKSVWWSWTAPTSGVYTATAVGLPGYFYPFLGVYTGSVLENLTLVASDTFNGLNSTYAARVIINATGGTTYAIAISTVGGSGGGFGLSLVPTVPPTVNITNPTNNATFYVGGTINLSVDAADSDGTVTNVAFYLDFALVGTVTNSPYHLSLAPTNGPLNHRLQAWATDNWGVTTVSSEVQFLVTYPPPVNDNFADRIPLTGASTATAGNNEYATREPGEPTQGDKSVWWSWTAPTSGVYTVTAVGLPGYFSPFLGVYTGSALANLSLVASDSFNGLNPPYAARVVINATGGAAYPIAMSTVGGQGGGLSLSIVPTVPPTVIITSPTNNAIFYVGEPVNLTADASDSDGTVTNVEFYLDFARVASFTSEPYHLNITFTNGDFYSRLQVRATDNWGVTTVSSEVQFLVTYPPPDNDAFADRISLSGSALTVTGNNQYATREPGELTQGDKSVWWSWTAPTSGVYTVTAVGLPGYFYPFLGVYTGSVLENLTLVASDTFNGLNSTYAARVVINATGGTAYALAVGAVAGQGGDLSLSIVPTVPPTVNITNPTNNATFYVGDSVTLSADASDSDGTVTNVEFYLDFVPVASLTSEPYQLNFTFTNGDSYHRFQVRATDNWGVTTVSSEVQFLVTYPPPVNDDFANRISIAGASVLATGDNRYATLQPGEPTAGDKSVWWSWTAPTSGVYTVTAVGLGSFYPFLGVYTGSALENLVLLTNATFGGTDPTYAARVVINATGGTAYALAVGTVAGQGGELNLSLIAPLPIGEPAKFDSITPLPDGSSRLVFRTGATSIWGLETSTNLTAWEGTYVKYLSQGLYEIHDFRDGIVPCRFYRLRAEP